MNTKSSKLQTTILKWGFISAIPLGALGAYGLSQLDTVELQTHTPKVEVVAPAAVAETPKVSKIDKEEAFKQKVVNRFYAQEDWFTSKAFRVQCRNEPQTTLDCERYHYNPLFINWVSKGEAARIQEKAFGF